MSDLEKKELDPVPEETPAVQDGESEILSPADVTEQPTTAESGQAQETAPKDVRSEDVQPKDAPPEVAQPKDAPPEEKGVNGISIGISLCDAVIYAVGRERFHGGVRPNNISVRDSRVFLGETLKHGVGEFTPQELEYMAPEMFWDGVRSPAADVYSIGLVLYSLYNYGRLPFWPTSGAITPNARASGLQRRMSDESLVPPERADAELAAVILRALAFRPEDRWHDVVELRDALGSCDTANSPADISLAMSGLLTRNTETRAAEIPAGPENTRPHHDEGEITGVRRPQPRRNLSWLWILLGFLFLGGAVVLLLNDQFGLGRPAPSAAPSSTPIVTSAPTVAPTEAPSSTPEPTRRPSSPKYVVYREDVSWSEAAARCKQEGGWLAVPVTETELQDITRLCKNADLQFAWLGASRREDGNWYSMDDEMITYFPWLEGEPSIVDPGDGVAEDYMLLQRMDEESWYFNDSRENPVADYPWMYSGQIGFVCQMWE